MHRATYLSSKKIDVYHVRLFFLFWFLWFFFVKEFYSLLSIHANHVSLTLIILSLGAISAFVISVAFFLLSWKPKLVSHYIYGIIFFLFGAGFTNDVYVAVTNEPYLGPEVIGYALAGPFTTFAIVGGIFESSFFCFSLSLFFGEYYVFYCGYSPRFLPNELHHFLMC